MRCRSAILVLAVLAQHGGMGCGYTCEQQACVGGLRWTGAPEDGAPIAAGDYVFTIELDGIVHVIECPVVAGADESSCTRVALDDDASPFEVGVYLVPKDGRDPTVLEFSLHAVDLDDGSVRGPTDVSIAIALDERRLFEETYALEYERDDDYFGDERCGFCDLVEQREATWPR